MTEEGATSRPTRELDRPSPDAAGGRGAQRDPHLSGVDDRAALVARQSEDRLDVKEAAPQILDEDHYGLDKVKDRIVEYIAVLSLKRDLKGPILCFVGPAGHRQDLASAARSRGRWDASSQRISLGGVRDEAEVRGHRRTYVGAMPGRDHPIPAAAPALATP